MGATWEQVSLISIRDVENLIQRTWPWQICMKFSLFADSAPVVFSGCSESSPYSARAQRGVGCEGALALENESRCGAAWGVGMLQSHVN